MRRPAALATAAALLALAVPAAAQAACPASVSYSGSVRLAEWELDGAQAVGEPVTGGRLEVGQTYYVPKGKSARVTLYGYTHRVAAGSVFLPQCDIWTNKDIYLRLLEGKVRVSGRAVRAGAERSPRGSYVVTPDATLLPMPGRAKYSVSRVVTGKRATSRTSVQAARGSGNLFVRISSFAARGKKVPCQAGARVTVFSSGKYRSG